MIVVGKNRLKKWEIRVFKLCASLKKNVFEESLTLVNKCQLFIFRNYKKMIFVSKKLFW